LHEIEYLNEGSDASHQSSIHENEIRNLQRSDADMQNQEQMKNDQSEEVISDNNTDDNNTDSSENVQASMKDNNTDDNTDSSENVQASMEDITDNESDEFDEDVYLRMTLTEWASYGVSKRKVNSLLSLLRKVHPELPNTCVTLLNTPKTTIVSEIDNGHMWYKGIKENLDSFLTQEYLDTHKRIRLNISIDGVPLDSVENCTFGPF